MKRFFATATTAALALTFVACGGGEPGQEAETGETPGTETTATAGQEAEGLSMPDWMQVDEAGQTVTLQIVAGQTDANNRWNFNGYANGEATVVVPRGYEVTIEFRNDDPANPHSVAIDRRTGGDWPATFQSPTPAFKGAMTTGAETMTDATQPGESETITFTAREAGDYSMVCYVPAHAATGMWIGFQVSADGEAGVRTP